MHVCMFFPLSHIFFVFYVLGNTCILGYEFLGASTAFFCNSTAFFFSFLLNCIFVWYFLFSAGEAGEPVLASLFLRYRRQPFRDGAAQYLAGAQR